MYLIPSEYETAVNGKKIKDRHRIYNGDRINLGSTLSFRLINPYCTTWGQELSAEEAESTSNITEAALREQEQNLRRQFETEKRTDLRTLELENTKKISECHMKMNQMEQELRKLKKAANSFPEETYFDLDDVQRILKPYHTTLMEDLQAAFRTIDSEMVEKVGEKLRNANTWCRRNQKQFEFRSCCETRDATFGMVDIEVINHASQQKAIWPQQRFDLWYESALEGTDILAILESEWTPLNGNTDPPESAPSTPRKALNALSELGRTLVRSPMQALRQSLAGAAASESRARRTLLIENKENILNAMKENGFESQAMLCLIDIQAAAIRLKKLCKKSTATATHDASLVLILDDDDEEEISEKLRTELGRKAEQIERVVHEANYQLTVENSPSPRQRRE